MRIRYKAALILSLSVSLFAQEPDVTKLSEAMGHIIGKNLQSLGLDFDLDAIVKGLQEESEGKSSPLNEDECVQAIAVLQEEKMATTTDRELQQTDSVSNGDQIHEDPPFSAPDSPKYR